MNKCYTALAALLISAYAIAGEIIVVVYDNNLYCMNPILMMANSGKLEAEGVSALVQKVVRA